MAAYMFRGTDIGTITVGSEGTGDEVERLQGNSTQLTIRDDRFSEPLKVMRDVKPLNYKKGLRKRKKGRGMRDWQ
jgi:hypothetical protein